jgi:imidazole glycerol phosphate synthase subunit HisF
MKRVFDLLAVLKMSCNEGLNGTWDCTTEEGRESFDDMITIIEWIEKELKENQNGEMFLNKG